MNTAPLTNIEICQWYREQPANIPDLNEEWIKQNVLLAERAENAPLKIERGIFCSLKFEIYNEN